MRRARWIHVLLVAPVIAGAFFFGCSGLSPVTNGDDGTGDPHHPPESAAAKADGKIHRDGGRDANDANPPDDPDGDRPEDPDTGPPIDPPTGLGDWTGHDHVKWSQSPPFALPVAKVPQ